jgi:hypothetical protein
MKLQNTHLIIDLISRNPKKYSNYKKLVLSEKSSQYSNSVKLNIGEDLIQSLDNIIKLFSDREYLFFFPNIDNNVIEVSKSNGLFKINYHIGYRMEIYTYTFKFKVGEGLVDIPKFNKELPPHLEMLMYEGLKTDFVDGIVPNWSLSHLMLSTKIIHRLLPMMVFIDLSKENVKLSYIKPFSKSGDMVYGNYIKNETKIPLYRVDSLWNIKSINIGEFKVRGHFRLQPCGIGRSEVKLIYIDEFLKTQYVRKSTKELVFG